MRHALKVMLKFVKEKKITIEEVVEKMCHNPAICFQIEKRGFIKENYYADLVLVDIEKECEVTEGKILAKCGWSPFVGEIVKWASGVHDCKWTHCL